jgi:hypothetical protein
MSAYGEKTGSKRLCVKTTRMTQERHPRAHRVRIPDFSKRAGRIIILAWPSIGIISIWGHFRPLTKCKPNKRHESDQTNKWTEPTRHI